MLCQEMTPLRAVRKLFQSLHYSNGKLSGLVPSPPQIATQFTERFPIELGIFNPQAPDLIQNLRCKFRIKQVEKTVQ